MIRFLAVLFLSTAFLAGCQGTLGSDPADSGRFRITKAEARKIPYRMQDSINALRSAKGLQPLALSAELTAAALTHSKDMSVQNRAWHFSSDGSSPFDRVRKAGYAGRLIGEAISESFESDVETLAAWMEDKDTRSALMDPRANEMGIAWYQEPNGKIWWTLVLGQKADGEGTSS